MILRAQDATPEMTHSPSTKAAFLPDPALGLPDLHAWFGVKDSNLHSQIQSLTSCH